MLHAFRTLLVTLLGRFACPNSKQVLRGRIKKTYAYAPNVFIEIFHAANTRRYQNVHYLWHAL
jgi:hypothetical protein